MHRLGLLLLGLSIPAYASRQMDHLVVPRPGATLPVTMVTTLKSGKLTTGETLVARLIRRVPVATGSYLPGKVEIVGHVASFSPSSLSIVSTELRWRGKAAPVKVRLVSAASLYEVMQAGMPLGTTDRSTSNPADWTTRQVGVSPSKRLDHVRYHSREVGNTRWLSAPAQNRTLAHARRAGIRSCFEATLRRGRVELDKELPCAF